MLHRSIFDPRLTSDSPRHVATFVAYRRAYVSVDCAAAVAFIIGSICFLDDSLHDIAAWLFIIGSVLFAGVPLISLLQGIHLRRLPPAPPPQASPEPV